MSIAAPSIKRQWALLGVAAGLVVLLATALVFTDLPGERLLSRGGDDAALLDRAELAQAEWQIKIHPAGVMGKVTKAQAARIHRQRPRVASLLKKVYDAMLLHPGRLRPTLAESFTPAAASAFRRSGVSVPQAGAVTTTKRKATVGIQAAGGPNLAIATVRLEASLAERPQRRIAHKATLWMERGKTGWKVVAFNVDQRPRDRAPAAGKVDSKKTRNDSKPPGRKNRA